jgi:hypothetical protein
LGNGRGWRAPKSRGAYLALRQLPELVEKLAAIGSALPKALFLSQIGLRPNQTLP